MAATKSTKTKKPIPTKNPKPKALSLEQALLTQLQTMTDTLKEISYKITITNELLDELNINVDNLDDNVSVIDDNIGSIEYRLSNINVITKQVPKVETKKAPTKTPAKKAKN